MKQNQGKIYRMVTLSLLAAIIVVLQALGGGISFGGFSITLVLIPVVIGAALYGSAYGAVLGGIFGVIVLINCANGKDLGGNILFTANPWLCSLICIGKGALAGAASGAMYKLVYRLSSKDGEAAPGAKPVGKYYLSSFAAAIVAPIVNTGLFCLGMVVFYSDILKDWAAGTDTFLYIITGLVGINFLIELAVNIICAPAVSTVLKAIQK